MRELSLDEQLVCFIACFLSNFCRDQTEAYSMKFNFCICGKKEEEDEGTEWKCCANQQKKEEENIHTRTYTSRKNYKYQRCSNDLFCLHPFSCKSELINCEETCVCMWILLLFLFQEIGREKDLVFFSFRKPEYVLMIGRGKRSEQERKKKKTQVVFQDQCMQCVCVCVCATVTKRKKTGMTVRIE